tara:strand:+ start:1706 stop:2389 length:684 start_codon:yes stop_codon:yes gene_type:complete
MAFSNKRLVAIIPVKETSERVPEKNFRKFSDNGDSLLDITINKLLRLKKLDHIYISTDKEGLDFSNKKNISIINRDKSFCNNITPWSDVIFHVANSIPEIEDTSVCWVHTTTPLFDFYEEAIEKFLSLDNDKFNSLVAVEKSQEFLIDNKGRPINYMFGVWHKYSQDLPELYKITGALFINNLKSIKANQYVIGTKPFLFDVPPKFCLDIDHLWQFELAQIMYRNLK